MNILEVFELFYWGDKVWFNLDGKAHTGRIKSIRENDVSSRCPYEVELLVETLNFIRMSSVYRYIKDVYRNKEGVPGIKKS